MARNTIDHAKCSKSSYCASEKNPLPAVRAHLFQHARSKERDDGEYGNNPHIANVLIDLVGDAPEKDGQHADKRHPILLGGELLPGWADRADLQFSIGRG